MSWVQEAERRGQELAGDKISQAIEERIKEEKLTLLKTDEQAVEGFLGQFPVVESLTNDLTTCGYTVEDFGLTWLSSVKRGLPFGEKASLERDPSERKGNVVHGCNWQGVDQNNHVYGRAWRISAAERTAWQISDTEKNTVLVSLISCVDVKNEISLGKAI